MTNDFLLTSGSVYTNSPDTATLLGLQMKHSVFSPVEELKKHADFV